MKGLGNVEIEAVYDPLELRSCMWRYENKIYNYDDDFIVFRIKERPSKDGIKIDTAILLCRELLETINEDSPCKENVSAIQHLDQALKELKRRDSKEDL